MTIHRMDQVGVVVDDLEAATAFFVELGMQYEDSYRLCYVRGPEGIIVALADQLS
jgi:hypothetical protein